MSELKKMLASLGLLHHSVVQELIWTAKEQTVGLYSNFDGLPEYQGSMGGSISHPTPQPRLLKNP
jgi:hypothetical protein